VAFLLSLYVWRRGDDRRGNGTIPTKHLTWAASPWLDPGPQISFAGGAAAAVYAAKRGKLAGGRDIASALMGLKSPDVLLIGGLFGVIGYLLWWGLAQIPLGTTGITNPIAALDHHQRHYRPPGVWQDRRLCKVPAGDNRWRASKVHAWLPWQTAPLELLTIGLGFGIAVSYAPNCIRSSMAYGLAWPQLAP